MKGQISHDLRKGVGDHDAFQRPLQSASLKSDLS